MTTPIRHSFPACGATLQTDDGIAECPRCRFGGDIVEVVADA